MTVKTKTTPWKDVWEWQAVGYGFMLALDLMQNGRLVDVNDDDVVVHDDGACTYTYTYQDRDRDVGRNNKWSSLERALSACHVWSQRCRSTSLPHAIESSYSLAQLLYSDAISNNSNGNSNSNGNGTDCKFSTTTTTTTTTTTLQLAYATTVIRSINGLADRLQQRRKSAAPVSVLCASLGVPGWIVDLRHECSHNQLSSLPQLRLAAHTLLGFFVERYWRLMITNRQEQSRIAMEWLDLYWKDLLKKNNKENPNADNEKGDDTTTTGILPIATAAIPDTINSDDGGDHVATESRTSASADGTITIGQTGPDFQNKSNNNHDNIDDHDDKVPDEPSDDLGTDDADDGDCVANNSDDNKDEDDDEDEDEDAWMETNYFAVLSVNKSSSKKQSRKRRKIESTSQEEEGDKRPSKQQRQNRHEHPSPKATPSTTNNTTTANINISKQKIPRNHKQDDPLKYAKLFLKQTPADVAFHVALLFFIWGNNENDNDNSNTTTNNNNNNKNTDYNEEEDEKKTDKNICRGGILFCPEEVFKNRDDEHDHIKDKNTPVNINDTIIRTPHIWNPLLQALCQAWPGFLSAFITHCVEYQLFHHPTSSSESAASASSSSFPATTCTTEEPDDSATTTFIATDSAAAATDDVDATTLSTPVMATISETKITDTPTITPANTTITDRLNTVLNQVLSDEFLNAVLTTKHAGAKSTHQSNQQNPTTSNTKSRVDDMRSRLPLKSLARRLARDCPIRQTLLQYSKTGTTWYDEEFISNADNTNTRNNGNDLDLTTNATPTDATRTNKANVETINNNNNKKRWRLVEDWEPCSIGSLPGYAV